MLYPPFEVAFEMLEAEPLPGLALLCADPGWVPVGPIWTGASGIAGRCRL